MDKETVSVIESFKIKYGEEKTSLLLAYLELVLERNEHINLTAVRDRDEAIVKHLADSLAVTDLPEYIKAETVIDVGTGAGFPGAVLAIADPEKNFVLLDSTLKRLRVIDEFAETLGLSNIRTLHARAEEINRKTEYNGTFDLCVSRAVASLDKLAGWCLPFVKKGGSFISFKGENYAAELEDARRMLRKQKAELLRVEQYKNVPADIAGHVLLVFSKQ